MSIYIYINIERFSERSFWTRTMIIDQDIPRVLFLQMDNDQCPNRSPGTNTYRHIYCIIMLVLATSSLFYVFFFFCEFVD